MAVFLIVLPLMLGHSEGWPGWVFACVGCGAVLAVVFIYIERRVPDPLLNLAALRSPGLGAGLVTTGVLMGADGGFLFSFGLHLQTGLGDSALRAGRRQPGAPGGAGRDGRDAGPWLQPAGDALAGARAARACRRRERPGHHPLRWRQS